MTCSILYQRGIYPAESFKQTQKYGLNMLVTDDEKLNDFFANFLQQLSSTSACLAESVVVLQRALTCNVNGRTQVGS